ncbi:glycosyltransferase family 2 protein [Caldimonas tepidiphila]|uniref:glycosyltransferase family 2 protein n=1 Tax=Caldimonas tepidiphila TaxID=2315841 RepID=UPI000E5A6B45|nr:glycosyltransferase family A protein [Caldimonas tepidiphila]
MPAPRGPVPRLSVVIPTFRRPDLLARCLEAVMAQTLAPEAYEVIVVDDGQTEDTREKVESIARAHPQGPRLHYLRPDGTRGPAAARNRGWRAARAPWIAFTDDDTRPERDWLAEAERAIAAAGAEVALRGRVVVPVEGEFTDHAKMTKGLETADFVTANAFVERAALAAVGGFDERFLRAWREDSDLCFMLQQHCGPVGRAPGAVVVHPVREAPWGLSLRQQANVYFDALLYKKHPRRYRAEIRPVPPWRYYAIVASTLAGCGSLLWGAAGPALLLFAFALAAIAGFALERLRDTSRSARHVAEMVLTSAAIPFLSVYWRLAGAWRFRVLFL